MTFPMQLRIEYLVQRKTVVRQPVNEKGCHANTVSTGEKYAQG